MGGSELYDRNQKTGFYAQGSTKQVFGENEVYLRQGPVLLHLLLSQSDCGDPLGRRDVLIFERAVLPMRQCRSISTGEAELVSVLPVWREL
jgi:hypothetical protein